MISKVNKKITNKIQGAFITTQRLTQKYTNDVQRDSQKHFGYLTERMYAYRDKVLNKKPYIDAERAILATESYRQHQEKPIVLKRALMFQHILENMTYLYR